MADLTGKDIGRYHIVSRLGQGGMAEVYKAFDNRLQREVALKVIRKDAIATDSYKDMMKRFEREARALARLSHAHIVKVHDYGEYEDAPYLVMEYLPGGTLSLKTRGIPIPWQETAALLAPIARALECAHEEGILHRDVKPANILLTKQGQPMLSDFGIAKILDNQTGMQLTGTNTGIGTPEYMAPEQWMGKPVPQTDIYALGVVFYELVTGKRPYTADTPLAVMHKQLTDPLPRPRLYNPALPEAVEQVLFKALAREVKDRYASMAEFAAVLERLAQGQVEAPAPQQVTPVVSSTPRPEAAPKKVDPAPGKKKNRRVLIIGTFLAVSLLAVVCGCIFSSPLWLPMIAPSPAATLVSGSQDGTTRQWTLTEEDAAADQAATAAPAGAAVVRPTPILLSSRAISVQNAAQVTKKTILDVSESGNVAWSPDGKWLLIDGRKIHYYDASTFTETRSAAFETGALAISPDSKVLAAVNSPGVMLFDLASGSELRTLPRTQISTSALSNSFLAFTPDSTTLAVIIGSVVKLFNITSGQETGTIVAPDAYNIAISPDGRTLYAGGWGEKITAWDIASGSLLLSYSDLSRGVNRMVLSPDGGLLASADPFDGTITLWEAATGRLLRTFSGHTQAITSLAFSPDGTLLASASRDMTLKLWNTATGEQLNSLVGHTTPPKSIAFSADGATLASSCYSDGVYLWSLPEQ